MNQSSVILAFSKLLCSKQKWRQAGLAKGAFLAKYNPLSWTAMASAMRYMKFNAMQLICLPGDSFIMILSMDQALYILDQHFGSNKWRGVFIRLTADPLWQVPLQWIEFLHLSVSSAGGA